MKCLIIAAALLCLVPCVAAQDNEKEPKPKGLSISYDKFRDTTLVRTDKFNLFFDTSGKNYVCTAILGYVKSAENPTPRIIFAVAPGGTGFVGAMIEGVDAKSGRVYFDPDADVIILAGGRRFRLGRVTKDYGFYPSGDYKGGVLVEVPTEALQAIAEADEWEMAIGSLEAEVNKPNAKKLRQRLQSLAVQFKKDFPESSKP